MIVGMEECLRALEECYKLVAFQSGRRERKVQRICEEVLGAERLKVLKAEEERERIKRAMRNL